jgi:hypothetical protein
MQARIGCQLDLQLHEHRRRLSTVLACLSTGWPGALGNFASTVHFTLWPAWCRPVSKPILPWLGVNYVQHPNWFRPAAECFVCITKDYMVLTGDMAYAIAMVPEVGPRFP